MKEPSCSTSCFYGDLTFKQENQFPTSPAGHVSTAAFPGAMLGVREGPGCPGQSALKQPLWVASSFVLLFADAAHRGPLRTQGCRTQREAGSVSKTTGPFSSMRFDFKHRFSVLTLVLKTARQSR